MGFLFSYFGHVGHTFTPLYRLEKQRPREGAQHLLWPENLTPRAETLQLSLVLTGLSNLLSYRRISIERVLYLSCFCVVWVRQGHEGRGTAERDQEQM